MGGAFKQVECVRQGADGPIAEETFFEFPKSGLFVDDYSKLPQPTTDVEKAKSDIDLYGYCEHSNNLCGCAVLLF